jgi:isopentenyl diphosphate isomerase/L-lactate dehydrogenase-like FMN-dependent dehydrogenase
VVWGLACGGERGVAQVLRILHDEFRLALMLNGCRSLKDVTADLLVAQRAKL